MVELDLSSAAGVRFGNTDALAVMIENELIWEASEPDTGEVTFPSTTSDYTVVPTGASNNLVFTVPANVADDDVLVAFVADRTGLTPPAGWVQQTKFTTLGVFGVWTLAVPDKTALSSSYTWTGASSGRGGGVMFRAVGADLSSPVAQVGAISGAGSNQGDATHFTATPPLSLGGVSSGDAAVAVVGSFYISGVAFPAGFVPGFTALATYNNGNSGAALSFGVFTDEDLPSGDLTCGTWSTSAQNASGIVIAFNAA